MTNDTTTEQAEPSLLTQSHYRAVLEWYVAMGVETAQSTDATNWYEAEFPPFSLPTPTQPASQNRAAPQRQTPRATQQPPRPVRAGVAQKQINSFSKKPVDIATQEARSKASQAKSIAELRTLVEVFEGCSLKVTATKTCFSDGNPNAPLMIIGEAPGRDEDIAGKPFVGKAGHLLNKMLSAIALDRDKESYITNIVFWRPPGNRNPSNRRN